MLFCGNTRRPVYLKSISMNNRTRPRPAQKKGVRNSSGISYTFFEAISDEKTFSRTFRRLVYFCGFLESFNSNSTAGLEIASFLFLGFNRLKGFS